MTRTGLGQLWLDRHGRTARSTDFTICPVLGSAHPPAPRHQYPPSGANCKLSAQIRQWFGCGGCRDARAATALLERCSTAGAMASGSHRGARRPTTVKRLAGLCPDGHWPARRLVNGMQCYRSVGGFALSHTTIVKADKSFPADPA
jgi:hypothetical protein